MTAQSMSIGHRLYAVFGCNSGKKVHIFWERLPECFWSRYLCFYHPLTVFPDGNMLRMVPQLRLSSENDDFCRPEPKISPSVHKIPADPTDVHICQKIDFSPPDVWYKPRDRSKASQTIPLTYLHELWQKKLDQHRVWNAQLTKIENSEGSEH